MVAQVSRGIDIIHIDNLQAHLTGHILVELGTRTRRVGPADNHLSFAKAVIVFWLYQLEAENIVALGKNIVAGVDKASLGSVSLIGDIEVAAVASLDD